MRRTHRLRFSLLGVLSLTVAPPLTAQITVGPNIPVSAARSDAPQYEVLLAADPRRAGRLLACSLIYSAALNEQGVVVYLSEDAGQHWTPTFERYDLMDPSCTYGVDGSAYLLAFPPDASGGPMQLYRSADGGRTWATAAEMRTMDRPYLSVDRSGGPYQGRLYVHGTGVGRPMDGNRFATGVKLYSSSDSGRTIQDPVQRWVTGARYVLGLGNGVVLSDGTLVLLFNELREYWDEEDRSEIRDNRVGRSNGRLRLMTSKDGGRSLSPATTVADYYMHVYPWRPPAGLVPWIAADASEGPFRDRLYVVWPDRRTGRDEIWFSYSIDRGQTWSRPVAVNDDRPAADWGASQLAGRGAKQVPGGDHFMPVVAVNQAGVVGVAWYDRRSAADNLGWAVRFTASLDGGETWLPSVPVSTAPNTFTARTPWPVWSFTRLGAEAGAPLSADLMVQWGTVYGGDTSGLVADSSGVFHVVWTDNRTGLAQLWSAAVTVRGTAVLHGAPELAKLTDLSTKVRLVLSDARYDRASQRLAVQARLTNVSTDTISGPLMLRVVRLESTLGVARIRNSENGRAAAGAVWDFTGALSVGRLLPGDTTSARALQFEVTEVVGPILPNPEARPGITSPHEKFGLARFDARVLGTLRVTGRAASTGSPSLHRRQ